MVLTRQQKTQKKDTYKQELEKAVNVVLLRQKWVPVNEVNEIKKGLARIGSKAMVARKRLLLQSAPDANYESVELPTIDGTLTALYSYEDEFWSLKVVDKAIKKFKKEKKESYEIEFLGWRYEKVWKDASYVSELASLPSKEELIGKLLFMLKNPVQSLAAVLEQIAKKKDEKVEEKVEDKVVEVEKTEELPVETKEEEIKTEEVTSEE